MEIHNKIELLLQMKALELHNISCLSSKDKVFQQKLLNVISFLRKIYTINQEGEIHTLFLPEKEDVMRPFRSLANKNMLVLPIKKERNYLINVSSDELPLLLSYDEDNIIKKYFYDVISSLAKCREHIEETCSRSNRMILDMSMN